MNGKLLTLFGAVFIILSALFAVIFGITEWYFGSGLYTTNPVAYWCILLLVTALLLVLGVVLILMGISNSTSSNLVIQRF